MSVTFAVRFEFCEGQKETVEAGDGFFQVGGQERRSLVGGLCEEIADVRREKPYSCDFISITDRG